MTIAELFVTLGIKAGAAEIAQIDKFIRQAEKKADKFLHRFNKKAGAFLTNKLKMGMFGAGAALGGIFVAGARDALKFDESLTRLDISSSGAMGALSDVRNQILAISKDTGVAKEEILAGAQSFVALTGDGRAAAQSMALFARVSKATGATMEDISGAAAAMTQNLKIKPQDFEKAFSILIRGGKMGAVELKDMAGLLAQLAPLAERFKGGGGTRGLAVLGSAFQLTRQGAGSAPEAATQLEALMGAIVQHAGKLRKGGVTVFDEKTVNGKKVKELRSLDEIVDSIANSKLARDPELLVKALGRKEAYAAFLQLTKVRGAWSSLATQTEKANDVSQDYAKFQESNAAKVDKAWNNVKIALAEAFTPDRIEALSHVLVRVLEFAARLVGYMEDVGRAIDYISPSEKAEAAGQAAFDAEIKKSNNPFKAQVARTDAEAIESGRARLPRTGVAAAEFRRQRTVAAIPNLVSSVTLNVDKAIDPEGTARRVAIEVDRNIKALLRDAQSAMATP